MSNHGFPDALPGLPAGTAGYVDHIGVAVADLDQALALYRDLLGLELPRLEEVPQENVRVAFLKLDRQGGPGHLELLAPMSEAGAIAAFIAKRGPGLHHVAVAARNVPLVLERCREAGLALIDQQPRPGAGGKQIAFVHPKGSGGVLLEICGPHPA
ncbi:methylmalonyl-CoA epimerase [bacterium]|nr:methylmalonyl-CoA epimerase [bacterium]